MRKYYDILGVPMGTSAAEIKRKYRELSQTMHPDKGGDTRKFQELTNAYSILVGKSKPSRSELKEQVQRDNKSMQEEWRRQEAELQNEIRAKKLARDAARFAQREQPTPKRAVARAKVARTIVRDIYDTCASCNGLGVIRDLCQKCCGTGNIVGVGRRVVQHCDSCDRTGHVKRSGCFACQGKGRIFLGQRETVIWE